jgi:hypothetical protein
MARKNGAKKKAGLPIATQIEGLERIGRAAGQL